VFVAATTECFLGLSLPLAIERLADLEFTSVELALFEDADQKSRPTSRRPSRPAATRSG
jgi:hypothetical protein